MLQARLVLHLKARVQVLRSKHATLTNRLSSATDFRNWAREELLKSPLHTTNTALLFERVLDIVCDLRARCNMHSKKAIWLRLLKHGRLFKEFSEVLPVAARVLEWIKTVSSLGIKEKITIVDLGSGVGYLSILLSELLSGNQHVARFVLVDKAFPCLNAKPGKTHINPSHLSIDDFWAFEMTYRKYNIQSSSGQRDLQKHVLARAPGPVVILGVHLCGVLSIRAVQVFNDHPRCSFIALKPCCLPHIVLARGCVWEVGGHTFAAKDVCVHGKYNKGKWTGNAPKHQQASKFKVV